MPDDIPEARPGTWRGHSVAGVYVDECLGGLLQSIRREADAQALARLRYLFSDLRPHDTVRITRPDTPAVPLTPRERFEQDTAEALRTSIDACLVKDAPAPAPEPWPDAIDFGKLIDAVAVDLLAPPAPARERWTWTAAPFPPVSLAESYVVDLHPHHLVLNPHQAFVMLPTLDEMRIRHARIAAGSHP